MMAKKENGKNRRCIRMFTGVHLSVGEVVVQLFMSIKFT